MERTNIKVGRDLQERLCEACRERLNERLTPLDVMKGARDVNHLLKIFKQILCKECADEILRAARK